MSEVLCEDQERSPGTTTSVSEHFEKWLAFVRNQPEEPKGVDTLYYQRVPRFKWFRPPMWKIFMWAYKIDKAYVLKNCYPSAMSSSLDHPMDSDGPKEITLEFKCNPINNERVNKIADDMKRRMDVNAEVPESTAK